MTDLPPWVNSRRDGTLEVDPNTVYPIYLDRLQMEPSEFSLEVARRCMTVDLRKALKRPFDLLITKDRRWRGANFAKGSASSAAASSLVRWYDRKRRILGGKGK